MTVCVFLVSFLYFACGASGAIPVYRDSGDLIASIHTLGIAHPPGYPLYLLLGHLFSTALPWGTAAYKTNLFSAFCGAMGLAFLYKALRHFSAWSACAAVAVLACTPAFVALARAAEMYTLAFAFGAAILLLARPGRESWILVASFLLGLGMGVHPTLMFFIPVLLGAVCENGDKKRWPIVFIHLALVALVGCSIVLYLPVRAHTQPLQNWGDPSSWERFWRVLTRADYGGLKLHPVESTWVWTPASIGAQLEFFVRTLNAEWGAGALLIAGTGGLIGFWWGRHRPLIWGMAAAFLLAGPLFFLLSNLPLQEPTTPAILQPYLLLPDLFIGAALAYALALAGRFRLPLALSLLVLLGATFPRAGWTFRERRDFLAYDYGRDLLRELPPRAVLFDPDDPTSFTLRALQVTEGRRTDVWPLNFFRTRWGYAELRRRTDLLPPEPIANGQDLEHALWTYAAARRPFFAELPQKLGEHPYASNGLVYAAGRGSSPESRRIAEDNLARLMRHDTRQATDYPDFFARHLVSYYAAAHCNLGLEYAQVGEPDRAAFHYQMALSLDPRLAVAYNNWGNLAFARRDFKRAAALYGAGLAVDPGNSGLEANLQLAQRALETSASN